jgi:hypothetical protein
LKRGAIGLADWYILQNDIFLEQLFGNLGCAGANPNTPKTFSSRFSGRFSARTSKITKRCERDMKKYKSLFLEFLSSSKVYILAKNNFWISLT